MKPKILFCTVFYNEFNIDEDRVITRNNPPLPIEISFDNLAKKSIQKHEIFIPRVLYELEDFYFEWRRVRCTYIDEGRNCAINNISSQAIIQEPPEDYDYYWFIDSDISFTLENVLHLLKKEDYKVLSGAYAERNNPKTNWVGGWFHPDRPGMVYTWVPQECKNQLISVDWHGAGFLKIHRSVFPKLKFRWFDVGNFNYTDENGIACTCKIQEDIYFCLNLLQHGFQPYVDTGCIVGHHIKCNSKIKKINIDALSINDLKLMHYDLYIDIKNKKDVLNRIQVLIDSKLKLNNI